jgi:hypothetical protein
MDAEEKSEMKCSEVISEGTDRRQQLKRNDDDQMAISTYLTFESKKCCMSVELYLCSNRYHHNWMQLIICSSRNHQKIFPMYLFWRSINPNDAISSSTPVIVTPFTHFRQYNLRDLRRKKTLYKGTMSILDPLCRLELFKLTIQSTTGRWTQN